MSLLGILLVLILIVSLLLLVVWGYTTDTDNDGIADRDDECPNSLENYDGYQDDDGCIDAHGIWKVKIEL